MSLQESPIKRALISVFDKTNIVILAKALHAMNIEILSTGGTAQLLRKEGVPVQEVSEYTGFPEIMGGRVKTLHPKIHGGLLGRRGVDEKIMSDTGILSIDLLVVNLYPFAETIQQTDCTLNKAMEQVDIGGPTMLRAAAKNFTAVTTLVDPEDYFALLDEMQAYKGATTITTRFKLAQKVFAQTAQYEANIANYFNRMHLDNTSDDFPNTYTVQFTKKQDLRYGENPHQKAALYIEKPPQEATLATAHQYQGKELSFNNIARYRCCLRMCKSL